MYNDILLDYYFKFSRFALYMVNFQYQMNIFSLESIDIKGSKCPAESELRKLMNSEKEPQPTMSCISILLMYISICVTVADPGFLKGAQHIIWTLCRMLSQACCRPSKSKDFDKCYMYSKHLISVRN